MHTPHHLLNTRRCPLGAYDHVDGRRIVQHFKSKQSPPSYTAHKHPPPTHTYTHIGVRMGIGIII